MHALTPLSRSPDFLELPPPPPPPPTPFHHLRQVCVDHTARGAAISALAFSLGGETLAASSSGPRHLPLQMLPDFRNASIGVVRVYDTERWRCREVNGRMTAAASPPPPPPRPHPSPLPHLCPLTKPPPEGGCDWRRKQGVRKCSGAHSCNPLRPPLPKLSSPCSPPPSSSSCPPSLPFHWSQPPSSPSLVPPQVLHVNGGVPRCLKFVPGERALADGSGLPRLLFTAPSHGGAQLIPSWASGDSGRAEDDEDGPVAAPLGPPQVEGLLEGDHVRTQALLQGPWEPDLPSRGTTPCSSPKAADKAARSLAPPWTDERPRPNLPPGPTAQAAFPIPPRVGQQRQEQQQEQDGDTAMTEAAAWAWEGGDEGSADPVPRSMSAVQEPQPQVMQERQQHREEPMRGLRPSAVPRPCPAEQPGGQDPRPRAGGQLPAPVNSNTSGGRAVGGEGVASEGAHPHRRGLHQEEDRRRHLPLAVEEQPVRKSGGGGQPLVVRHLRPPPSAAFALPSAAEQGGKVRRRSMPQGEGDQAFHPQLFVASVAVKALLAPCTCCLSPMTHLSCFSQPLCNPFLNAIKFLPPPFKPLLTLVIPPPPPLLSFLAAAASSSYHQSRENQSLQPRIQRNSRAGPLRRSHQTPALWQTRPLPQPASKSSPRGTPR